MLLNDLLKAAEIKGDKAGIEPMEANSRNHIRNDSLLAEKKSIKKPSEEWAC